jgi:hypothetical protein
MINTVFWWSKYVPKCAMTYLEYIINAKNTSESSNFRIISICEDEDVFCITNIFLIYHSTIGDTQ